MTSVQKPRELTKSTSCLKAFAPTLNARRTDLAARYQQRFEGLPVQPLAVPTAYAQPHAWHLYILRIDSERCGLDREAFMKGLQERGIGTGIHFI